MRDIDFEYMRLLNKIALDGYKYEDPNRTGVIRMEIPQYVLYHKSSLGYPIISLRKTFFKGAVAELMLFLKGETDIREYWKRGVNFWDSDWKRHNGISDKNCKLIKSGKLEMPHCCESLGPIYPTQYKRQYNVFDKFKESPMRTDLIVNSWQLDSLDEMALIPCHYDFQILGHDDGGRIGFYITWNQRSTDVILGTPINVQFYFLMGMLLEKWSGYKFNGISGVLKKAHIYDNGFELFDKIRSISTTKHVKEPKVDIIGDFDKWSKLSFENFISEIDIDNFKIQDYSYVLDDRIEMITYSK